jgi:cell wall assembly regulator SMI1
LLDINEFAGNVAIPDPGVQDAWWDPGWISIASDGGGDSVCIDLHPATGGTAGQVILMNHENGFRPRLAGSFTELLSLLVDYYEQRTENE